MTREMIKRVSSLVADAVNDEDFDSLADNIDDILDGLNDDERKEVLAQAKVVCIMASQPGCLPDAWEVWEMHSNPGDIHGEIMTLLGEDDFEDDGTDWDAVWKNVTALDLAGDSINAPDGRIIEIFEKSCGDIIRDNRIIP